MSASYWIWLRLHEHHKEWQWEVRTRAGRSETAFLKGWDKKREGAIEDAKAALKIWLEAEATVEHIQVVDDQLIETPEITNRRERFERASTALFAFVTPYSLPVNPEDLDLMAYCALEAADSERTLDECLVFAQDEIKEDRKRQKVMESEQRKS